MTSFPADRTVIVTGAVSERGIGRATADFLAERGWNVGVIDLDDAASKAVAKELAEKHGVKAHGAGANVGDEASVRAAIDEIEAELPQLVALAPSREAVAALAERGRFPVYDLGGGLAAAYTAEHRPPSVSALRFPTSSSTPPSGTGCSTST